MSKQTDLDFAVVTATCLFTSIQTLADRIDDSIGNGAEDLTVALRAMAKQGEQEMDLVRGSLAGRKGKKRAA
jgi:hypothetical protein